MYFIINKIFFYFLLKLFYTMMYFEDLKKIIIKNDFNLKVLSKHLYSCQSPILLLYNKYEVMELPSTGIVKYHVKLSFEVDGLVEKADIIGAIFGQTEGLLGPEMNLNELQKVSKVGRIEVNVANFQVILKAKPKDFHQKWLLYKKNREVYKMLARKKRKLVIIWIL